MNLFEKIAIILSIGFYFFFSAPRVYAENEFKTSYQITYTVNQDASVLVEQNITLENRLANIYAKEYQLNLGATQVSGLTAWDEQGSINPQITNQENTTQVNLQFNQIVVGKGEKLNFGLSFLTSDFAFLNGQVLQVAIPRIADSQSLVDYQAVLKIPAFFEQPFLIQPQPVQTQNLADFNLYFFNKEGLVDQSIFASFGEKQFIDFQLNYDLDNTEPGKRLFELALPPETSWQKIILNTLQPVPENVKVDADGNWLAEYILEAGEQVEVLATGSATLYLIPQPLKTALAKDLGQYLKSQEFWPSQNSEIKDLANQLKSVDKIYDYVVETLNYDYDKINSHPQRMGALQALREKDKAVCMEFTDLFVSLCRAVGIPAREINGYAYTQNPRLRPLSSETNVLHSWPEYFDSDKKLWMPVDPTWEKTSGLDFFSSFDLSHLVLVIHGLDSQYPVPSGDLKVDFSLPKEEKEKFSLKIDSPAKALAGTEIKVKVKVENSGNVALIYPSYGLIPPFGSYEQEISLGKTSLWTHGPTQFQLSFANQEKSITINIISVLYPWLFPYGLIAVLAFGLFMVLLKIVRGIKIKRSQI